METPNAAYSDDAEVLKKKEVRNLALSSVTPKEKSRIPENTVSRVILTSSPPLAEVGDDVGDSPCGAAVVVWATLVSVGVAVVGVGLSATPSRLSVIAFRFSSPLPCHRGSPVPSFHDP